MGVDLTVLDFLLKFRGKVHGNTLQLGKQGFHVGTSPGSNEREIANRVIRRYDPLMDVDQIAGSDGYTTKLFEYLGSNTVSSLDASSYEGADIVHDLNMPISDDYISRYDTIFDGGTIEHVFNLPIVFDNVKRMLKLGGLFLSVNAANNQLGHGFYQFSPELMWRVFSKKAGFRVDLMQIAVVGDFENPVNIPDPADVGTRLEIGQTLGPAYILVAATKIGVDQDGYIPIQSDYLTKWENGKKVGPGEYVPDTHGR